MRTPRGLCCLTPHEQPLTPQQETEQLLAQQRRTESNLEVCVTSLTRFSTMLKLRGADSLLWRLYCAVVSQGISHRPVAVVSRRSLAAKKISDDNSAGDIRIRYMSQQQSAPPDISAAADNMQRSIVPAVSADQCERAGELSKSGAPRSRSTQEVDDKVILAYFTHLKEAGKKDGSGGCSHHHACRS
jgi:hypothetical protein